MAPGERFPGLSPEHTRLYLKGPRVEASLHGDPAMFLRIIAAAREGTDSVEELLKEARYYDSTVGPDLLDAREDTIRPESEFQVDVAERKVVFPGDRVEFAHRGVLPYREGNRENPADLRTFVIPPSWEVGDFDRNHEPMDRKGELRREKEMWRNVLPPPGSEARVSVDGVELDEEELRDLQAWVMGLDDRAPEIQGKSVYELVHEGMRKGAVTGRRSAKPHRADAGASAR